MARVLVVDDDLTVREVLASYLRAGSHDVVEAGDGEQALRAMSERPADIVILHRPEGEITCHREALCPGSICPWDRRAA